MTRPAPSRGQLLAACAALFYALQNLTMRAAAPWVDPFVVALFAGVPTLLLALSLTLGSASKRRRLARLFLLPGGRRLALGLAAAGLVMCLVGNPLFVHALALGGAVVATPSANTVVIWSALLAALFLGERLTRKAVIGVAVFIGGVLLLAVGQGTEVPAGAYWFWAIPLGVTAGLCWSSGSIGTRLAHSRKVDTFAILSLYGVAGLGGLLAVVLATGRLQAFAGWAGASPDATRILTLLALGGLFNLGAQLTITLAFLDESVARVSVISSSAVTIVAVLAWAFLGDALNLVMFAGILAVFTGAALVQGQTAQAPEAAPPAPAGGVPGVPAGTVPLLHQEPTKRQEESPDSRIGGTA